MAFKPRLQTEALPSVSEDVASSTASPARGKARVNELMGQVRVPVFRCKWDLWHEKPIDPEDPQDPTIAELLKISQPIGNSDSADISGPIHYSDLVDTSKPVNDPEQADPTNTTNISKTTDSTYSALSQKPPRTVTTNSSGYCVKFSLLREISDIRQFWIAWHLIPLHEFRSRHSLHLFHVHTKPIWEDPRNARGGAWNFRVPKAIAIDFWKELCLLATGEQLQNAVESDQQEKKTFRDDICGLSYRPKFASTIISVWNRDAEHEVGKQRILKVVLEEISEEVRPREWSYSYKKHAEQEGFSGSMVGTGGLEASVGRRVGT